MNAGFVDPHIVTIHLACFAYSITAGILIIHAGHMISASKGFQSCLARVHICHITVQ
jgi:hypothetical protein